MGIIRFSFFDMGASLVYLDRPNTTKETHCG